MIKFNSNIKNIIPFNRLWTRYFHFISLSEQLFFKTILISSSTFISFLSSLFLSFFLLLTAVKGTSVIDHVACEFEILFCQKRRWPPLRWMCLDSGTELRRATFRCCRGKGGGECRVRGGLNRGGCSRLTARHPVSRNLSWGWEKERERVRKPRRVRSLSSPPPGDSFRWESGWRHHLQGDADRKTPRAS